jgi:hypothetical protein
MKKLNSLYRLFVAFIVVDLAWIIATLIIFARQGRL